MNKQYDNGREPSDWSKRIIEFVGDTVIVDYEMGKERYVIEGTLQYFNFNHSAVLLYNDDGDQWIKNPVRIRRKTMHSERSSSRLRRG